MAVTCWSAGRSGGTGHSSGSRAGPRRNRSGPVAAERDASAAGPRGGRFGDEFADLQPVHPQVTEVGPAVNSPRNDGPECLDAA